MAQISVQYRTNSCEMLPADPTEFWYDGDGEREYYASIEEAVEYSNVILDWRDGPNDLTAVRVHDRETGKYTYIAPFVYVRNA